MGAIEMQKRTKNQIEMDKVSRYKKKQCTPVKKKKSYFFEKN